MGLRFLKDEIFLLLQVKEGHGFGFATAPLIVTANLAGNIHESFVTEPCPQPKFEIEFVWIMDKAKLKSMWSDKIPLRIDCFTLEGTQRNRIGYIILNLKDIQIIQCESKIVEKQIRLLGLSRVASMMKPELVISFFVTDVPIEIPKLTPQFSPRSANQPVHMGDKPLKVTLGTPKDHFLISVKPDMVNNLKLLLPSQSEVEPQLVKYTYSLLGAVVVSGWAVGHGVQLAVTSSLACLMSYLVNNPVANVSLQMGDLLIGQTTISLEDLLLTSDDIVLMKGKPFNRSVTRCCEVTPTQSLSVPLLNTKPTVDFTVSLRQEHAATKRKPKFPPILPHSLGAGGDADCVRAVPLDSPPSLSLVSRTQASLLPDDSGRETYRTQQPVCPYTVTVTVTRLQLRSPQPHYWLRLSHPSGSVSPSQPTAVVDGTSSLQWRLSMTMPRHLLEPTLATGPPTLHLGLADREIACARLAPPDTISTLISGEQRAVLMSEEETVAEVGVTWTLSDITSKPCTAVTHTESVSTHHTLSRTDGTEFLSPREREIKILSVVEELEDWAEKQRIIIMEELEEEKAARLVELQKNWEQEMGGQVTEGQQLVQSLQNMRDQLKQRETELMDSETKLKVYKEDLERIHRNKLLEFKDLSCKMQDEFNNKLAIIAKEKVAVEKEVEELRSQNTDLLSQNAKLTQALREAENRNDADKKLIDNLNHEQYILNEKLTMEQESKKFFKDHCRKAEQEIQRLNGLRLQEQESRISIEKRALEQLGFQQLIFEQNDQQQEKHALEEIRHQLFPRSITDISKTDSYSVS